LVSILRQFPALRMLQPSMQFFHPLSAQVAILKAHESFRASPHRRTPSMLARPLLGPDPDEKLARHLDVVRRLELAQLSLNFQPSLFTLSFSQLFDGLPK